jgi:hypothetical protein
MPKERVYQSGATKRKKRAAERQEAAKSRKVFEGFFKKKPDKSTENKGDHEHGEEKYHHSDDSYKDTAVEETLEVEMPLDERSSAEETSGGNLLPQSEKTSEVSDTDDESSDDLPKSLSPEVEETVIKYKDFGYIRPGSLSEELRAKIVLKGSLFFQNKDEEYLFPTEFTQNKSRSLTSSWFTRKLPTGEICNRSWLLFSPHLECLFCFACVLFSEAPEKTSSALSKPGVGFTKWKKPERLKEHEEGVHHRQAFLKWKLEEERLKAEPDELSHMLHVQILKNQQYWRKILKRVAAAVKYLAKTNSSLRAHKEKLDSPNPGNFLASLKFLAEFDEVTKHHLHRIESGKTHYLSPEIQNEFINLMGNKVRESIVGKVKQVCYFSLMLDSTPDVSHQEQVSLIVRYLDVENFEIKESFLGYFEIVKPDAQHYEELVLKTLKDIGLDFDLCRGQTYDNAATMSGRLSGLQKRLLDINPKATFLNCDNHSLNLAALHSAEIDPAIVTFFGTVHELFNFFSNSPQRWAKLKEAGAESLKKESSTRWSSREEATSAVSLHLDKIIKLLERLSESTTERMDTRSSAQNLLHAVENYEFFAYLEFWSNLLRPINIVQKKLQKSGLHIREAAEEIKTLSCFLQNDEKRTKLITQSIERAKEGSECYGFPVSKTTRRKKRLDGELSSDVGLSIELQFKRVAIEVLDRLHMEMKDRFQRLENHVDTFGFLLEPRHLLESMDDDTLMKNCVTFSCLYDEIQANRLFNDVIDARALFINKPVPQSPIDILRKLASYGNDVCSNLATSIRILLTQATSIASCERSFSKLKLIKNYLRSTMTQERLSSMALMSVESKILDSIDLDDVIDAFAAQKARREAI